MSGLNIDLIKAAMANLRKQAFVPSDAAAGADPSGGGAPPGGDPSGGAPPMPDAMPPGGDPGGSAPMPPPEPPPAPGGDIAGQVAQGVSQALAGSGLQGNKGMTAPKPDINTVATDIFQLKKMFLHFIRTQGIELPPDILDGPNRDPMTGAPAMGPSGGSDAQPGSSMQAGGQPQSAIKPISPMQGTFPSPAGGGGGGGGGAGFGKMSGARIGEGISSQRVMSKAAAAAMLYRRRKALAQ